MSGDRSGTDSSVEAKWAVANYRGAGNEQHSEIEHTRPTYLLERGIVSPGENPVVVMIFGRSPSPLSW